MAIFPSPTIQSLRDAQANFDKLATLTFAGTGTPEGNVAARVGATYHRLDGGAGTSFYVKETGGTGATGWIGK
jgi:L-aminopeptidase/D-esterase-like protein